LGREDRHFTIEEESAATRMVPFPRRFTFFSVTERRSLARAGTEEREARAGVGSVARGEVAVASTPLFLDRQTERLCLQSSSRFVLHMITFHMLPLKDMRYLWV
jgi:hypothetical protein